MGRLDLRMGIVLSNGSSLVLQTVNTAARMESNGQRNKVHISQKTAELIRLAGKGYVFVFSYFSCKVVV
jgi:class 3 adenylate cyclase